MNGVRSACVVQFDTATATSRSKVAGPIGSHEACAMSDTRLKPPHERYRSRRVWHRWKDIGEWRR